RRHTHRTTGLSLSRHGRYALQWNPVSLQLLLLLQLRGSRLGRLRVLLQLAERQEESRPAGESAETGVYGAGIPQGRGVWTHSHRAADQVADDAGCTAAKHGAREAAERRAQREAAEQGAPCDA
ncbi:hypothetical protein DFH09DRAFT_1280467, partial [Mycena vulgaris]